MLMSSVRRCWLPLPSLRRVSVFFAALCTATLGVAWTGARLEQRPRSPEAAELIYLPQAKFLRPLSLGYHMVLADVLWFRTISYFGDHYRSDRNYKWLAYMCDLVTDLDPGAEHVYRFAGMILPWEAHQPEEGIRLLEKGTTALPNSWLLQYWLGFSYYFFMEDYDNAVRHTRRAAELPDAHPNAARLAALLYQHANGPEMAVQFLREMEHSAENDEMREVMRDHLREAKLAADVEHLNEAVAAYRTRFNVTPPSLSALVEAQILPELPRDPFGGVYEIDAETGAIRSSTGHEPARLHRSQNGGPVLRGPLRD